MRYACQLLVLSFLATVFSVNVFATTNFQEDSYEVYIGPVDDDTYDDIYFKAKEKLLLIAGEITIPIPFQDSESGKALVS